MAVGMAIAERHLNAAFGDGLVDHRTWVIAGDGCLMEGDQPRSDRARRAPRPGPADRAVGRQPHHHRRRHRAFDQRGYPGAATRPPAGMSRAATATTRPISPAPSTPPPPTRGLRWSPAGRSSARARRTSRARTASMARRSAPTKSRRRARHWAGPHPRSRSPQISWPTGAGSARSGADAHAAVAQTSCRQIAKAEDSPRRMAGALPPLAGWRSLSRPAGRGHAQARHPQVEREWRSAC